MVRTLGLTHIALAVKDAERSLRFYEQVLGVVPVYRSADFIQAQTPGSRDVLVFQQGEERVGMAGGIIHFGFRLASAAASIPYRCDCSIDVGGAGSADGRLRVRAPFRS